MDSLWAGRKHIEWDLRKGVNILSGINGIGKSTILNRVVSALRSLRVVDGVLQPMSPGLHLEFVPSDAEELHFDVIRSFDRPMVQAELVTQAGESEVRSELDWQLYQLQRKYLDFQVNMGNRMIELLQRGDEEGRRLAAEVPAVKTRFLDIVDQLFAETGKKVMRKSNELRFEQQMDFLGLYHGDGEGLSVQELSPYKLSSGEKQMLIILLTALVQNQHPHVMLMDEPEISLHIDWQQRLIGLIRELNPNAQIILTTHSPAMIMDGWLDSVTEVSDITH
ncbi:MAG: ATP-binding protein [Bacteroidaceae bacterium]|nr:ATP-binding protein [Bacteroidaceae bacterium]